MKAMETRCLRIVLALYLPDTLVGQASSKIPAITNNKPDEPSHLNLRHGCEGEKSSSYKDWRVQVGIMSCILTA